jgi:hypothetical protein
MIFIFDIFLLFFGVGLFFLVDNQNRILFEKVAAIFDDGCYLKVLVLIDNVLIGVYGVMQSNVM